MRRARSKGLSAGPMPSVAEVDVKAIARKALNPTRGKSPDQVIEAELRKAGVVGSVITSIQFARLYQRCCDARAELMAARPKRSIESVSAADLWAAYTGGLGQQKIARLLGVSHAMIIKRSFDLGFVRVQDGPQWIVIEGPCTRCGSERRVEDLDERHRCNHCR